MAKEFTSSEIARALMFAKVTPGFGYNIPQSATAAKTEFGKRIRELYADLPKTRAFAESKETSREVRGFRATQRVAFDDIIKDLSNGNYGGFVEMPTGTGKSYLAGKVLRALEPLFKQKSREAKDKMRGSLILVHSVPMGAQIRKELIKNCGIKPEDIAFYDSQATVSFAETDSGADARHDAALAHIFDVETAELTGEETSRLRRRGRNLQKEDGEVGFSDSRDFEPYHYLDDLREEKRVKKKNYTKEVLGKRHVIMTYAAFQSFYKRHLIDPENRPVVILDEADLSKGDVTSSSLRDFARDAYVLGVTATERFLRNGRLRSSSEEVLGRKSLIHRTTIDQAVERQEIIPVEGRDIVLDYHWKTADNDYREFTSGELTAIAAQEGRNQAAIKAVETEVPDIAGKSSLWYATDIDQAKDVATLLNERYGKDYAVELDGGSSQKTVDKAFEDFASGKLKAIVSAQLLVRGKDLPKAEVAVCLAPSRSPTKVIQIAGRVMRRDAENPDKTGTILQVRDRDIKNLATFNALRDGSFFKGLKEREAGLLEQQRLNRESRHVWRGETTRAERGGGQTGKRLTTRQENFMRVHVKRLLALFFNGGQNEEAIAEGINAKLQNSQDVPRVSAGMVRDWKQGRDIPRQEAVLLALMSYGNVSQRNRKHKLHSWRVAMERIGLCELPPPSDAPLRTTGAASGEFIEVTRVEADAMEFTHHSPQRREASRIFRRALATMLNRSEMLGGLSDALVAECINGNDDVGVTSAQVRQWRIGTGILPNAQEAIALTHAVEEENRRDFHRLWLEANGMVGADLGVDAPCPESKSTGSDHRREAPDATVKKEACAEGPPYPGIHKFCDRNFAFFGKTDEEVAARINKRGDVVTAEDVEQWRAGQALPSRDALEAMKGAKIIRYDRFDALCSDIESWRRNEGHPTEVSLVEFAPARINYNDAREGMFPGMQEFCNRTYAFFSNNDQQIAERINKKLPPEDAISPQTVANWRAGEEIPGVPVAQALVTALNIAKPRGDAFIRNLKNWHDAADAQQSVGEPQAGHADAVRERRAAGYEARR